MNVNYTTYDLRREQDTVNPNTDRRDIMCLRSIDPEEERDPIPTKDRYIYGRVLGVYHANIAYGGPGMLDLQRRRIDFLWVRWYDSVNSEDSAALNPESTLERLCFPPLLRAGSTAFLDPNSVLRACHIVPRFSEGRKFDATRPEASGQGTTKRKGKGTGSRSKKSRPQSPGLPASRCAGDHDDWHKYYINRCVEY